MTESSNQTALEQAFSKVLSPFQNFIEEQKSSSIILISATLLALMLANSEWAQHYSHYLHYQIGLLVGQQPYAMSFKHWVNDGLMAIFFFVIGVEIKRELLAGEIRDIKKSAPILVAALGGMLVPALFYFALTFDTAYASGWGIPMATDTAFAIGVLALLGARIPSSAFAFITALAIVDDLGAIVVIALFYTESIQFTYLYIAAVILLLLILANAVGLRRPSVYILGGVAMWLAMLVSGIHATVAGILVAATIPARSSKEPDWFIKRIKKLLRRFERIESHKQAEVKILEQKEQHQVVENVLEAAHQASTPLKRWENALRHPVALLVMPIFAFTNAGVSLDDLSLAGIVAQPLSLAIMLGLVAGKCLGISLFAWLAIKLGMGELPEGLTIRHIIGLSFLCGIGFTMSIFIAGMSFGGNEELLAMAKIAILIASTVSGVLAYAWLYVVSLGQDS